MAMASEWVPASTEKGFKFLFSLLLAVRWLSIKRGADSQAEPMEKEYFIHQVLYSHDILQKSETYY